MYVWARAYVTRLLDRIAACRKRYNVYRVGCIVCDTPNEKRYLAGKKNFFFFAKQAWAIVVTLQKQFLRPNAVSPWFQSARLLTGKTKRFHGALLIISTSRVIIVSSSRRELRRVKARSERFPLNIERYRTLCALSDRCSYKLRKYGQIRCSTADANKSCVNDNDTVSTARKMPFLIRRIKCIIFALLIANRLNTIIRKNLERKTFLWNL